MKFLITSDQLVDVLSDRHDSASPFLSCDDEQIVEEEEVDGDELHPRVEDGASFGHFLQLPFLLQESCLGDDRDGLGKADTFTCLSK